MTTTTTISKQNHRYSMKPIESEQQFQIETEDVNDLSLNEDYLSMTSSSSSTSITTTTTTTRYKTKNTKKTRNFFALSSNAAQQAARQLMKLFSKKHQETTKTITTITTRTTTLTTLKATALADDEDVDDDVIESSSSSESLNRMKTKENKRYRSYPHHHHYPQIHHRIPFYQKNSSKNLKSIQIKLDRLNNNNNNCLSSNNNNTNHQSNTDLGFTVIGYCPCQIGKVEPNSIAFNAGLQAGDLIIKINGKNVSRATSDSIIKIIKNLNDQYLVLDINQVISKKIKNNHNKNTHSISFFKQQQNNELLKIKTNRLKNCNKKQSNSSSSSVTRYPVGATATAVNTQKLKQKKDINSIIRSKTTAFLKEQQYHHRKFITMNNKYTKTYNKQRDQFLINSNNNNIIINNNKSNLITTDNEDEIILAEAAAAAVVVAAAATVTSSTSAMHSLPSPIPYLPPIKTHHHHHYNHKNKQLKQQLDSSSSVDDYEDYNINGLMKKTSSNHHGYYYYLNRKKSSITDSDYKTQSSTTATDNDADNSPTNQQLQQQQQQIKQQQLQDEKYIDLEGHMSECEQIFRLEEEFISLMQSGVQQYSRPLRHLMMISQLEHHLLFQNIEKILVLSEYQLNQLISHDESALIEMFNTIGKLYENKMRMSCEAFDIYLNGIENSFNLLISLIKNNSGNKKFNKFLYDSKTEMDLKTFLLLPLYYVSNIYNSLKKIRSKITTTNCDHIPLTNLINSLETHVNKSNLILSKYDNNNNDSNKNLLCDLKKNDLIHSGTLKYKHKLINLNLYKDRLHLIGSNVADNINQIIHLDTILKCNFNLANKLEFQFSFSNNNNNNENNNINDATSNTIRLRAHCLSEKHEWNKFLVELS